MTLCEQTHRLTTAQESLEVLYQVRDTKVHLKEISLKTEDVIQRFQLSEIWINSQPARYIKGFKAQITRETALVYPEAKEGKLYLSSDAFATFSVHVQYASQESTFNVSPKLRVTGLRTLIESKFNCSNFKIYEAKADQPLGELYTLECCGITNNTSMTVLLNEDPFASVDAENNTITPTENGLGMATLPFVNFKDEELLSFNIKAPIWRTVIKGLNLEGSCPNEECRAVNQLVCDPKGMNVFHMHEACIKATCPSCHQKLESVTNCIFWDCKYTIEGLEENSTEIFRVENKIAPKNKALSFAEVANDRSSNLVHWKYLKITTSHISSYYCILI